MRHAIAILAVLACVPAPLGHAQAQERPTSSGSGFVVAPGRALTNHHVIDGCQRVSFRTPQGQVVPARVLAADPRRDLALLGYEGEAGPPLKLREGPAVQRGEAVVRMAPMRNSTSQSRPANCCLSCARTGSRRR